MTRAAFSSLDLPLGAEFDVPSRDLWLGAVAKVLKGADFEARLVSRSFEDLRIEPLATRGDWSGDGDPAGFPGSAPFRRGAQRARPAIGAPMGGWDIRQSHGHPDPQITNRAILEDLERGVTSIQLRLTTGPEPTARGVHVPHLDALDQVLKGVFLDLATVAVESDEDGLAAASLLIGLWDKRGYRDATQKGALNMDPLGCFARGGTMTGPLDETIARAAALAAAAAPIWPSTTAFCVDTRPYHDAGAGEAQELAAALATGLAYTRAMEAAGLPLEAAFSRLLFTLTVDADVFLSIAKIRAARTLWARVAEACGLAEPDRSMAIHAVTASRMLTTRDPWVNILRTTVSGFAGAVAGADSITVLPYTAAAGQPDRAARRIARNIQIVLMEESGLGRVMDPAGGSWAIETATDRLMEKAWSLFQDIEAQGGMAQTLRAGTLARAIGAVRARREAALATRELPITGVSEFPNLAEPDVPLETVNLAPLRETAEAAAKTCRGDGLAIASLEALARSRDETPKAQMIHMVDAAKARTFSADLSRALREAASGPSEDNPEPLVASRMTAPFEALRTASDRRMSVTGTRPIVLLLPLGRLADSNARATFARNFYAAGGLDAFDPGPLGDAQAAAAAFEANPSPIAILCSSADVYADWGAQAVAALRAAGATHIVVTGRPGELPAEAGIDRAIYTGCDALEALRDAHGRLSVA